MTDHRRTWPGHAALALLGLALAACQTGGTGRTGDVSESVPLGGNLVGEACRLEPAQPADLTRAGAILEPVYQVYCGEWERPSGQVVQYAGQGPTAVASLIAASDWKADLDNRAACGAPRGTSVASGSTALLVDCTLRNGGFPYIGFGAAAGNAVYLADGIPAAQPALEAAVGVLSGQRPAAAAGATDSQDSEAISQIEARLSGRLFGAGDLGAYEDLMRVGHYYNSIKAFAEAERRYRQAAEINARLLGPDNPQLADPLMLLALEASNQERFIQADALFARAEQLVAGSADPADRARLASYRALNLANQQRYDEALALARESTALRRQIAAESASANPGISLLGAPLSGAENDPGLLQLTAAGGNAAVEVAQSLYIEASLENALGRPADATATVNDGLGVLRAARATAGWWYPQLLELRGRIALDHGRAAEGHADLQSALDLRQQLAPEARPVGLSALYLGRLYADTGQVAAARESYRAAAGVLGRDSTGVRYGQIQPYLDLLWAEAEAQPAGADAVYQDMFQAAQLVRSSVTEQAIADAAIRLSEGDNAAGDAIRQLQDARRQRDSLLFAFNRASANAADPSALDDIRGQIAAAEARISELEPQVQSASPRLNLVRDQTAGLDDLRGLLRPGEALLQIALGDPHSYVFLVTAEGITARRLDITERQTAVVVQHLRQAFSVQGGSVGAFDADTAHLLYQKVLGPVEAELAGITDLVVVPSGALLNLPLGVLVTAPPGPIASSDYSHVAFLAERVSITIVPSVRSFVDLRGLAQPSRASRPFLGFGDFVPSRNPRALLASNGLPDGCLPAADVIANAAPLPGTASQVRAIAAALGGGASDIVLGSQFTEEAVERAPLSSYRVLLFATHAFLPGALDCLAEPALLTSLPRGAAEGDDGLLSYSEIFGLTLDADVVVLSACNTGGPMGEVRGLTRPVGVVGGVLNVPVDLGEADRARGESLTGLARAFFYAGARSILASHWEVYQDTTVALITDTFRNAAAGTTLARALQQAQIAFATSPAQSHPYFWGAFELIGDGGQVIGRSSVAALP